MTTFLFFVTLAAAVYGAGWFTRGLVLEFEQQCLRHDLATARAIREQADEMLFNAELAAITARALTTDTTVLPTIRVRVGRGWAGLKDWAHSSFGSDGHEGWDADPAALTAIRREHVSRRNWPMRHRPTPLVMPQHLPPDPERALRVHTLVRSA